MLFTKQVIHASILQMMTTEIILDVVFNHDLRLRADAHTSRGCLDMGMGVLSLFLCGEHWTFMLISAKEFHA
jgi:hypothetical protein